MFQGFLLSLLAGLATGLGALFVIVFGELRRTRLNFIIGIVAGMMLTVSFISLLSEAIESAGLGWASIGFLLGSLVLLVLDVTAPHIHLTGEAEQPAKTEQYKYIQKAFVISLGIALHNMPEGLAVAASFSLKPQLGFLIALVIGAHNIPEGIITALPLQEAGVAKLKTFSISLFSGLAEPLAALVAFLILQEVSRLTLAISSAFAAGAMVYITADELLPDAYVHEKGHWTITGLICGVLAALVLTTLV